MESKLTGIRFPQDFYKALKDKADEMHISVSDLIRIAASEYLKK